ncbi:hypothetical protein AC579_8773 [Pseudocercospora musae]|uniref:Uncharacterized protein n=1 Tax=Pseudocercospora musae TaxID=113226 RepID=A0A139IWP1_9PEZI|nr:hypothetical protein AC579_8773 [Pseudocercospora musae]
MSAQSVNVFALFAILFSLACIASAPRSIPERDHNDGIASKVGCGAVSFVLTTYLPKPHATAFCDAYMQVAKKTQSPSEDTPSAPSAKDQAQPTSTMRAYRKASIPEFKWLRERQSQESTRSTILKGPCSCLSQPDPEKTSIITITKTTISNNTAKQPREPASLPQISHQLHLASVIAIESGLSRVNVSLESAEVGSVRQAVITARPVQIRPSEKDRGWRHVSNQLAVASMIAHDDATSNVSMRLTDLHMGRLGLLKLLEANKSSL